MKRRLLTVILLMLILVMPSITPVHAQSNHSLEWGVEPGEEYTYVLQRAYYANSDSKTFIETQLPFLVGMEVGQIVILEVDHFDSIETLINESTQLPRSFCNLVRENDSAVIKSNLTSLVVPIGDWEFLGEIENITASESLSLIDTDDEWGTIGTGIIPGSGGSDITVSVEMRYEKENGTLSYLRHKYTTLGNDLIDVIFVHWYPGMPTIVGGGLQTTTLLIIAVSGLICLVVAFIVYRSIKGKKPIIQQLGE
jgi:hypothetical protein